MIPKPLRFLASIRLAVIIILALATITAVGTITEARYDAEVAQKLVYQSFWMYLTLGALAVNLIAVMVDRWPWKQHHTGFVLAHVGILFILFGAWLTQKYGIDGTMTFGVGDSRRTIVVRNYELNVYSTLDGTSFRNMYQSEVDFLRHPPTPEHPYVIHLGSDELRFTHFENFAFRDSEITATKSEHDGPAVRFELENPNVNLTQWLRRENRRSRSEVDLGPAKVVLTSSKPDPDGHNEVVLITKGDGDALDYLIYNKDGSVRKKGRIRQSETVETGWMGMKFRLLRYLPHAKETITYTPSPSSSPLSSSALQFTFNGETYWIGLDSALRLYLADRMYIVSYGHRQLELAFPLKLVDFTVGKYQGTDRAASYESQVDVPGRGTVKISMNEPLKYQGFTFYQSSFEKDDMGKPIASILSVNRDPGRWVKYFGCAILILGCVVLFYFKRVKWWDRLTGPRSAS